MVTDNDASKRTPDPQDAAKDGTAGGKVCVEDAVLGLHQLPHLVHDGNLWLLFRRRANDE